MGKKAAGVNYNWPPSRSLMPKVTKPRAVDNLETVETAWMQQANCLGIDPELFFPERGTSTREPKDVCRGCVVREECLEFALTSGEKFGIWGGLSERERRRLRRQRRISGEEGA